MLLPTKHLSAEQSLLWIGAEVLMLLDQPKTVSQLWDELKQLRTEASEPSTVTYDWFVLALNVLYVLGTVDLSRGRLRKVTNDSPNL